MNRDQIESAAISLAAVLDDIAADRIEATDGQRAYIAGAQHALLALLGREKVPNLDLAL